MSAPEVLRGRERLSKIWDTAWTSFGFLPGLAMIAGLALGLGLPAVDDALAIDLPVLTFDSGSSAQSLLETIGTAAVSVAGLSFSVTVVAFTLASSQLSPRVLRSFRRDRTSQATLAALLGTFVYCLVLLVRLGASDGGEPPNLSITLAVLFALGAFAMFAAFIAHIVGMLQPSSVIDAIGDDASSLVARRYPRGPGKPEDLPAAAKWAMRRVESEGPQVVRAETRGYLTLVQVDRLIATARSSDAFVAQRMMIGAYVLPGQALADVWVDDPDDALADRVRSCFTLGRQRTLVQDVAFPIRQLADIALKGLSPGINDPTTAENAMEALSAVLIEFARADPPAIVRVDETGEARLLARAPELDDLIRLGFDQVRVFAGAYPVVSRRLLELLEEIGRAARKAGREETETSRQRQLVAIGAGADGPPKADIEAVRRGGSLTVQRPDRVREPGPG